MSHTETAPAVRLTIEDIQEFLDGIREDTFNTIDYDPAEPEPDPLRVTDKELIDYQMAKVDYEEAYANFEALEDILLRGVALTSNKDVCTYCDVPFPKYEKRPKLFCPACGQLVHRKGVETNEKNIPAKVVPNALPRK